MLNSLQMKRYLLIEAELKRNNASVFCFLRKYRDELVKAKPDESDIQVTKGWLRNSIDLCLNHLSLYSMLCVGKLLIHNNLVQKITIRNSKITNHHLEALDITIGDDKEKVITLIE